MIKYTTTSLGQSALPRASHHHRPNSNNPVPDYHSVYHQYHPIYNNNNNNPTSTITNPNPNATNTSYHRAKSASNKCANSDYGKGKNS